MTNNKVKPQKFKISPFVEAISIRGKYFPESRPSVIYGQEIINWKQMHKRVCQLANGLRKLGLKKQEKVTFIYHNRPEFLEINFACQLIGAVPVPCNYRYVSSEIEYLVNNSDSVIVILEEEILDEVLKVKDKMPKVRHFILGSDKKVDGFINYEEFIIKIQYCK